MIGIPAGDGNLADFRFGAFFGGYFRYFGFPVGDKDFLALEACIAKMRFDSTVGLQKPLDDRFDGELLEIIENYPEPVADIHKLYCENVDGVPCILETKSGGLRLDAYILYIGKKMTFKNDEGRCLEIFAEKGLMRVDPDMRCLKAVSLRY